MKFDYKKLAPRNKSLGQSVVGIDELAKIFSGSGEWSRTSHMEQYGKSLYVFAAINKIATKVAAVDLHLYRMTNTAGDSEEIFTHDILDLLARINPFQTRTEFLKTAWINKKLTGEAMWWKVRNARGEVVELWNLRPDMMSVVADEKKFIKRYELHKFDGSKEIFAPEDIIHFREPNPMSPLRGLSPLEPARYRIETEELAAKFQRNFFGNNGRPDALLVSEEMLDGEQREQMTDAWEERHTGVGNSSRIGILEGGMKYQQVSITQREMDFIESMKFTRDDILVAFGVPKSVVTSDEVNYANAEAGIKAFLAETIVPEMDQLCEVLNEFLLAPEFGEEYFLDHTDPTPADRAAMRLDHKEGYGRWLTTNEIRNAYNLPPVEGGDEIAQLKPVGPGRPPLGEVNGDDAEDPAKKLRKQKAIRMLQGRPLLRKRLEIQKSVVAEVSRLISKDVTRKLRAKKSAPTAKKKEVKKDATPVTLFDDVALRSLYYEHTNKKLDRRSSELKTALAREFAAQEARVLKALERLENDSKGVYSKMSHAQIAGLMDKPGEVRIFSVLALPFLLDYARQGGEDIAEMTGEEFNFTDALRESIDKRAAFFAAAVTDTTFRKLSETISQGVNEGEGIDALTSRVRAVYKDIPEWRAQLIARTETTNANNEGVLEQLRNSSVAKGKEWIATLDTRTRDEHYHAPPAGVNGQIVPVNQVFNNGLMYPSEPNCRCVLAPALAAA